MTTLFVHKEEKYQICYHVITNVTNTQIHICEQVQTEDQYQFCYRAALEYLSSFDHYTDNWQSGKMLWNWIDKLTRYFKLNW